MSAGSVSPAAGPAGEAACSGESSKTRPCIANGAVSVTATAGESVAPEAATALAAAALAKEGAGAEICPSAASSGLSEGGTIDSVRPSAAAGRLRDLGAESAGGGKKPGGAFGGFVSAVLEVSDTAAAGHSVLAGFRGEDSGIPSSGTEPAPPGGSCCRGEDAGGPAAGRAVSSSQATGSDEVERSTRSGAGSGEAGGTARADGGRPSTRSAAAHAAAASWAVATSSAFIRGDSPPATGANSACGA